MATVLDTEDAIQLHLDAYPDDHTARQVLANLLDERGDLRGPGYRAMGRLGLVPHADKFFGASWVLRTRRWMWYRALGGRQPSGSYLPPDWICLIYDATRAWTRHTTRRLAEDAAALAFSRLPPERQAELLGTA